MVIIIYYISHDHKMMILMNKNIIKNHIIFINQENKKIENMI